MKSELYYEVHVTIDPVTEHIEELKYMAAQFKFRMANLIMVKSREDHVEDMFFTTRTKDYDTATKRVWMFIRWLQDNNLTVRRYKIEDTLLDSSIEDKFRLLNCGE